MPQLPQLPINSLQIDGRLTLGENIADNGGVHTAYRAYKNAMTGIAEQTVHGHTGDQLFFVAFAQVLSHKQDDRYDPLYLVVVQ